MRKKNSKLSEEAIRSLSGHISYSVAEIMASGGATAFANKKGKHPKTIADQLRKIPLGAFLTPEEAKRALEMLTENK